MLKFLIKIAKFRWTKLLILSIWILSLLLMIDRGWVVDSWEWLPNGMKEHKQNYFDIKRNSFFIWTTFILFAYMANGLRKRSLGYYGLLKIIIGLSGGIFAIQTRSLDSFAAIVVFAASAFAIVDGAKDISVYDKQK